VLLTDVAASLGDAQEEGLTQPRRRRVWRAFGLFVLIGIIGQLQYMLQPEDGLSHQLLTHLDEVRAAKNIYAERLPLYNTRLALKWRDLQPEIAPSAVLALPRTPLSSAIDRIIEDDGKSYSLLLRPRDGE